MKSKSSHNDKKLNTLLWDQIKTLTPGNTFEESNEFVSEITVFGKTFKFNYFDESTLAQKREEQSTMPNNGK